MSVRPHRLRCKRLIKTGARLVRHVRYAVFQMAEAALPRQVFAESAFRGEELGGGHLLAAAEKAGEANATASASHARYGSPRGA